MFEVSFLTQSRNRLRYWSIVLSVTCRCRPEHTTFRRRFRSMRF